VSEEKKINFYGEYFGIIPILEEAGVWKGTNKNFIYGGLEKQSMLFHIGDARN
jgi:hypothetical protein